ncbi:hypothetical protein [Luteolibacter luteus]|uniref:Uncharacterized protein n=1 Tax=Luteolibacter luteus TaxID=2728835 RepID=A0A858RSQ3_9BACT|nr:hypothetical protein [Luteolibacter luteus]QJE99003.1 hypothetical protein HHL09_25560 [Luteolibacter luteus]
MYRSSLSFLALSAALLLPAQAGIQFVPEFEAGSKWFTESWSAGARTEMVAFLNDVGALFNSDATARVRITDDAVANTYASAGSSWADWYQDPATGNVVRAPGLWLIVVKGITNPAAASDVTINWNLDVATLYGGNSASLISNIRGLGRHEMHHAFGCASQVFFSSNDDTRGELTLASVADLLYRDSNGQPVLGNFNPANFGYTINNFPLPANWTTTFQTGLYFEARDRQGRVVPMAPIAFKDSNTNVSYIDFSHIKGIAYANDHPTWSTYVDTDLNFLRAMGYPLMADSALLQQPAKITSFNAGTNQATVNFETQVGKHYRLATSTDLQHWQVLPTGMPGTGAVLDFSYPINKTVDPKRFFQVVEVSE